MGNWHCVENGCARVVWREYLPPSIRYRYPGQDWVTVDGDAYSIEQEKGQCDGRYYISTPYTAINEHDVRAPRWGGIFNVVGPILKAPEPYIVPWGWGNSKPGYGRLMMKMHGMQHQYGTGDVAISYSNTWLVSESDLDKVQIRYELQNGDEDNCGDCTLTIRKNHEIVHQETRSECPEVELVKCRLSEQKKELKVQKEVDTEAITIVNKNSSNCLEIWQVSTDNQTSELITTICSAEGCPPPEYEVVCEGDSCPQDTWTLERDGTTCCYLDDGYCTHQFPTP